MYSSGYGETERRYHLWQDFGVRKSAIKRNFYDNDRDSEFAEVESLLKLRTQSYTLPEIRKLFAFLWTAHDDCVLENTDEFSPLQVFAAKRKVEVGIAAVKKLEMLEVNSLRL